MARPRRKKRTRIRTAAATVQRRFRANLQALREDPTRVLPECIGTEPRPVARIRKRLEAFAAGKKPGLFDRRNKGVVGAVVASIPLADMESFPRLIDLQVAGKRRFFLQRGHISQECTVGVQNHDDPLALLAAWREVAHKERIHFFAGPRLWCSGDRPSPPDAWWTSLSEDTGIALHAEGGEGDRHCPHADRSRLVLRFPDGPALIVCAECASGRGKSGRNLHGRISQRHAGPSRRRPLEVSVRLAGGEQLDLPRDQVATYLAGMVGETELLRNAVTTWRQGSAGSGAYIVGETVYEDQDAFLGALDLHPWEREPLRAMTQAGHSGPSLEVQTILKAHQDRLVDGVTTLLGDDGADFVHSHGRVPPREMLRLAYEEAGSRARLRDLPKPTATGPVGRWVDGLVRYARTHTTRQTMDHIRKTLGAQDVPPLHIYAFVQALDGTGLSIDAHFTADQKEAGRAWADLARKVLEAQGPDYVPALARYLQESGTGEDVD